MIGRSDWLAVLVQSWGRLSRNICRLNTLSLTRGDNLFNLNRLLRLGSCVDSHFGIENGDRITLYLTYCVRITYRLFDKNGNLCIGCVLDLVYLDDIIYNNIVFDTHSLGRTLLYNSAYLVAVTDDLVRKIYRQKR